MKYYTIEKQKIKNLFESLKNKYRIAGPTRKENQYVINFLDSPEELILLHKPPILSLKKYYLPQEETLFSFKIENIKAETSNIDQTPLIIFGAHTCDIAGILCLDNACGVNPIDKTFFKRKKNIIIIGIECLEPCDEHATCITMGTNNPKGGYDLMLTDIGEEYAIQINSPEGENLVNNYKFVFKDISDIEYKLSKNRQEKDEKWKKNLIPNHDEIGKILSKTKKNTLWDEIGKKCVSCGNCTNVCPTCYCFDVKDDIELNLKEGKRYRTWDSCQLKNFAEVAGGENFREERKSRQQHRFFRKFLYCVEKYNRNFCVGCGRCTRACMAKINLYETINSLAKENI
ncbi:MAG: 4Fe-4S dicluster domain-containing protein [bacterium]